MKYNKQRLPILLLAVGILAAAISCFLMGILREPVIRTQEFPYTVTYRLDGEVKTLEGVFRCKFDGHSTDGILTAREYVGTYTQNGIDLQSHILRIAEKNGAELSLATVLDAAYLMGDPELFDFEPGTEDPYLAAVDAEGYEIPVSDLFDAQIISWEYPAPLKNDFTFAGFSPLHIGSMLAMLLAGLLTTVAMLIFVKKDLTRPRNPLDTLSVLLSFALCFLAIPFITVATCLLQLAMDNGALLYQIFLCVPGLTAFTVAASIALRRHGFTKAGLFVQLVGPAIFLVPVLLESVYYNLFG